MHGKVQVYVMFKYSINTILSLCYSIKSQKSIRFLITPVNQTISILPTIWYNKGPKNKTEVGVLTKATTWIELTLKYKLPHSLSFQMAYNKAKYNFMTLWSVIDELKKVESQNRKKHVSECDDFRSN